MSAKLKQLRDQRGKLVADARAILDKAETEKRALTAEEDANYKKAFADQDELRGKIEREEQLAEAERTAAEQSLRDKDAGKGEDRGKKPEGDERKSPRATDEYRAAFNKFIVGGRSACNEAEQRALQADSDTAGGYIQMPEQMVDQLIKAVDNMVFIRQRATKFRIPEAASLGVPTLTANPADAAWTTELATGNEDSTMAFGKRELNPHPLAKRIKVSNKLLRVAPRADTLEPFDRHFGRAGVHDRQRFESAARHLHG